MQNYITCTLLLIAMLLANTSLASGQQVSQSEAFIGQVGAGESQRSSIEPWERTAGEHFHNFDKNEIRQRLKTIFGGDLGVLSNTGLVEQFGDDNYATVVQSSGTGNQAVVMQNNSGSVGFNPPGNGNPNPPPHSSNEGSGGGNVASVVQDGGDNSATVLQGVTSENEQMSLRSRRNREANPPPFNNDGSGDHEAYVEQHGDHNTAYVAQSGAVLPFTPPGLNSNRPLPDGNGTGGSVAGILQEGSDNTATIVQYGNSNLANIVQFDSDNIAEIMQSGRENSSFITQHGIFNQAFMSIVGNSNDIHVNQKGNNNLFDLDLEGNYNYLNLTQDGDGNTYERFKTGDAVLNETVYQFGNNNVSTQSGVLSGGRSANITQVGNGLELRIRHE